MDSQFINFEDEELYELELPESPKQQVPKPKLKNQAENPLRGPLSQELQLGPKPGDMVLGGKQRPLAGPQPGDVVLGGKRNQVRRLLTIPAQKPVTLRPLTPAPPPPPVKISPAKIAQTVAKQGVNQAGKRLKLAIPIIGEVIGAFQLAEDISNIAKDVDLVLTQAIGLPSEEINIQKLIEGKKSGEEIPFEPFPTPPLPNPVGFPTIEELPPALPPRSPSLPVKGEGWHKARISYSYSYSGTVYDPYEFDPGEPQTKPYGSVSENISREYWILGPVSNVGESSTYLFVNQAYPMFFTLTGEDYFYAKGRAIVDPENPGLLPHENKNPKYRGHTSTEQYLVTIPSLWATTDAILVACKQVQGGKRLFLQGGYSTSVVWLSSPNESPYIPLGETGINDNEGENMNCSVNQLANQVAIQNNIQNTINQQTQTIQNTINNTTNNSTSIQNIQSSVANIQNSVNNVQATTTNVQNSVNNVQNVTNNIQNVVNNIKNVVDDIKASLQANFDDILLKMKEGFDFIKAEIQKVLEGLEKLGKWLKLDKIVNLLTLAMTIHNAAMLSNNLFQSAMSAIGNLLTFLGNAAGLRDVNDEPIDITETVGDTIENLVNSVFGAGNVTAAKKAWQGFSTIYQAASNVLLAVQSLSNVVHGLLEVCNERVAIIGNALKKWGAISEKAYGWMNPYAATTNRFTNFVQNSEDIVSQVDMVTMEATEGQQILNELPNQIEALQKSLRQDEGSTQKAPAPEAQGVKLAEQASKASSQSVDIANSDLTNPDND